MSRLSWRVAALAAVVVTFGFLSARRSANGAVALPGPPPGDGTATGSQVAVLAGGCFWGVEAVFERIRGVTEVVSGYAGGRAADADYGKVSSGRTGHAESVRITFDPDKVSYGTLLEVFFSVAHDPTQLNRQGPDVGPQYRSAIFFTTEDQARVARAYIEKLDAAHVFPRPIVTTVTSLSDFYPAEPYHQDYFEHHPNNPYIVINDRPKVDALRERFPALYRDR